VTAAVEVYGRALERPAEALLVRAADGSELQAEVQRWLAPVTDVDLRALARVAGPVLDVGCGPGRHVGALATRGVLALGVDLSPHAIRMARRQGALVLERSIFDRLPGVGAWGSALLLDGNIGIGGRPVALLGRLRSLLRRGGAVLVELGPPGSGAHAIRARLEHGAAVSDWFDWARVAVDTIERPAVDAGFAVAERWCDGGRWFALLRAP
jgi:SAM-dependent methyltransferase